MSDAAPLHPSLPRVPDAAEDAETSHLSRMRQALRVLGEAALELGPDGVIRSVNPYAVRVLDQTADELVDASFFSLVHRADVPIVVDRLRALSTGRKTRSTWVCRVRDRRFTWIWFNVSALSLRSDGSASPVLLVLRGLSDW